MLQDLFDKSLENAILERAVKLIEGKIEAEGVRLSKRDRAKLRKSLEEHSVEELSLGRSRWWDRREISVEITSEDIEAFQEDVQDLLDALPNIVPEVVEDITPEVVSWIRRRGLKSLRKSQREVRRFQRRLEKTWREPLELLDLVVHLAIQVGLEAGSQAVEQAKGEEQLPSLIVRLHGRGVRIAQEVATLLRGGYPDAALARWRTLHEVTTIASFVYEHGEACAARYAAHQAVANYKGARTYQATASRLGYVEFTEAEMVRLREARDDAVAEFGRDFGGSYGWAANFLGNAPTNFAEIEKAVSFDHYRSIYKWASQEVHAGVKALFSDLTTAPEEVILVGPSDSGFTDPAQYTCLSLAVVSGVLLPLGPTIDGLVTFNAMNHFVTQAQDAFIEVQRTLESRL